MPKSAESQQINNGLLTLLPMLYVGWADGLLTPTEAVKIRERLEKESWMTEAEKERMAEWLDPRRPPGEMDLRRWLQVIRASGEQLPAAARQSLANLGVEMARIGLEDQDAPCISPEACTALADIEEALGVVGHEAAIELLTDTQQPRPRTVIEVPESSFDLSKMTDLLDGPHKELRRKVRRFLTDPAFHHEYGLDKDRYREKVLSWCREVARQGWGALSFPQAYGGENDIAGFIAVFENLALHDQSLVVKFGVQFGLFGGSILNLGSERHHEKYLTAAGDLSLPGCFAMTETGHGSNVRDIETTAEYDSATKEFVVHTPNPDARKDYIGNAACHGKMATVFAQLIVAGERHGVHALLVPIRDAKGDALSGVTIEDCGEKLGLNGVDNGRLSFEQVRVPRENLLNRFGDVSESGAYSSSIASASRRFFTMLGTLVGGRISVSAASTSAAKTALTIAVRYAFRRRQFGPAGQPEQLIIDYPTHQERLFPLIANAYAYDFAQKYLVDRYVNRTEEDSHEVEFLAAGIKALSTWNCTHTIQTCREACGGKGYLAENRFAALKADTDIFTTFEGDNTVLLQLTAKGLLTQFRHRFSEMNFLGIMKYAGQQAATAITELNPLITRMADSEHLRDPEFHLAALRYREEHLLVTAAKRIKKRIDNGQDSYQAFLECQLHLVNLAKAYVERVALEQFQARVAAANDTGVKAVLNQLCCLYALSRIEADKGWFLEHHYLEGSKAKAIRKEVSRLCRELRDDSLHLVNAFDIPDACIGAPIAVE